MKKTINKWIKLSNAGLQMAVIITLGVFAGDWLDGKYPHLHPLFTVVLSLLGVFVAMFWVFKQIKNISEES